MTSVLSRFGHRCRELRLLRGVTMGDQSARLGYSVNRISSIECGALTPPDDYLHSFKDWMKLDEGDFQDLKKTIRSNIVELNRVKGLGEKGRSMRLFRKISQMTPAQIRAFKQPPDNGVKNE